MENTEYLQRNSYDQVPYMGLSHSLTHPDVMATAGRLLGLNPADIRNCRVLELGCANASNLMPMAISLPGSQFFGLDSSGFQINQGQQTIATLGLKNISLKLMNIMDVDDSLGRFDYIIVHGIFSWVPEEVRDRILTICDRNLASEGIAYISYNTFPGWHQRKIIRDMMLYHIRNIHEPRTKIEQARSLLDFMASSTEAMANELKTRSSETYVNILKHEHERLEKSEDAYLFHEELEETNDPLYFYQFAEWAGRHNLQYLSEAGLNQVFMNDVPLEIRNKLVGMAGSILEVEQYRDFLTNRFFRCTLLVHKDLKISRRINTDRVSNLFAGSSCLAESSNPDIQSRSVEQFICSNESKMATDHPVTKAAMLYLSGIWPQVVMIDDLLEIAYESLRRAAPPGEAPIPENLEVRAQDMQTLRANLLKGFVSSPFLVELHVHAPGFSTHPGVYPAASPWARFQVMLEAENKNAGRNNKNEPFVVTNLRHERIELRGFELYLLYLLDGTRNREKLLAGLTRSLEEGNPAVTDLREKDSGNDRQSEQDLGKSLDAALRWLGRAALLIS
jgi:methyltransferase-like protein/cyclopropane fatty-acyl-phospholipid synthase-like methyltransferase